MFHKVILYHFAFTEDLTQYRFFKNGKKFKGDFCFHEKR